MKRIVQLFLTGLAVLTLAACVSPPVNRVGDAPPTTQEKVDLNRYAGLWYEVARFPNWFEKDCEGVTAEYALRDDGKIAVTNTCRKGGLDGKVSVSKGRARIVDPVHNSKLKVKFAPAWVPFAEGDYWILDVDEDYQTAVVAAPNGRYLWILSRNPRPTAEAFSRAKQIATDQGYDVSALYLTKQRAN